MLTKESIEEFIYWSFILLAADGIPEDYNFVVLIDTCEKNQAKIICLALLIRLSSFDMIFSW